MWSTDELKEVIIKNRTRYYFDDIIKIGDFHFNNILIDEKSCKNILVYDFSYKTLSGSKPLRTRFDEVDGFIRVYDGIRYSVLFAPEKHDAIYNKTRYLINQKCGITKHMFFLIIIQKSKFIHMIIYL